MIESSAGRSGFPPAYLDRVGSSFTDFLAATTPDLLPSHRPIPQLRVIQALVEEHRGERRRRVTDEPLVDGGAELAGHLHPVGKVAMRGRSVRRRHTRAVWAAARDAAPP